MRVNLERLTKRFGDVTAVDGVSLSIDSGEFFFLLGPSGCGKTTLLRALAGFEPLDGGVVRFDELDVTALPPEKRDTALVFQNYALWPHLTVARNIAFGLESRKVSAGQRRQRVAEALSMVRMAEYGARRPNQLSGGQQQRVALARALVVRPKLVLLDEPLSNLDARLRQQMRGEIRRIIKQSGHTAVYVTHDQQEALAMADRCAIMRDGRIEQLGPPREIYLRPRNRFVAEFLGDANLIPARADTRGVNGEWAVRLADGRRWHGETQADITPGDAVLCCVRPEAWRMGEPPLDAVNVLDGQLIESVYLGEVTRHRIQPHEEMLPETHALELHAPPRTPGPLRLWTRVSDTILLPHEDA